MKKSIVDIASILGFHPKRALSINDLDGGVTLQKTIRKQKRMENILKNAQRKRNQALLDSLPNDKHDWPKAYAAIVEKALEVNAIEYHLKDLCFHDKRFCEENPDTYFIWMPYSCGTHILNLRNDGKHGYTRESTIDLFKHILFCFDIEHIFVWNAYAGVLYTTDRDEAIKIIKVLLKSKWATRRKDEQLKL